MYCTQCGLSLNVNDKFCSRCGTAILPVKEKVLVQQSTHVKVAAPLPPDTAKFKNPINITRLLENFLYATIAADIFGVVSGVLQFGLLADFNNHIYSGVAATAAAAANDQRERIVGWLHIVIALATIVVFAMWIYRANLTVRYLGAKNMKHSPGWSVGCFFIPILNLWCPYQAMKEIWCASNSPLEWNAVKPTALLPWWWFLFIATSILGNISLTSSLHAEGITSLLTSTVIAIAFNALDILATFVALALVGNIARMQMKHLHLALPIKNSIPKEHLIEFRGIKGFITGTIGGLLALFAVFEIGISLNNNTWYGIVLGLVFGIFVMGVASLIIAWGKQR